MKHRMTIVVACARRSRGHSPTRASGTRCIRGATAREAARAGCTSWCSHPLLHPHPIRRHLQVRHARCWWLSLLVSALHILTSGTAMQMACLWAACVREMANATPTSLGSWRTVVDGATSTVWWGCRRMLATAVATAVLTLAALRMEVAILMEAPTAVATTAVGTAAQLSQLAAKPTPRACALGCHGHTAVLGMSFTATWRPTV